MKRENEIHVVKLPEYAVQKNIIISYQNWNEAAPEEFAGFLSYEKKHDCLAIFSVIPKSA